VTEQDVEPILERNHLLRSMPQPRAGGGMGTARRHHSQRDPVGAQREYARGNLQLRMFTTEFDASSRAALRSRLENF